MVMGVNCPDVIPVTVEIKILLEEDWSYDNKGVYSV
jgi:hypothetical protein